MSHTQESVTSDSVRHLIAERLNNSFKEVFCVDSVWSSDWRAGDRPRLYDAE